MSGTTVPDLLFYFTSSPLKSERDSFRTNIRRVSGRCKEYIKSSMLRTHVPDIRRYVLGNKIDMALCPRESSINFWPTDVHYATLLPV